ncbi:MAG: ParB/RepB/Spo0J family partition protein [Planctomycetes bacterium]|nr:ParB/RepB/Spo0J family partition protein [Planctomycetota bacterium]
MSTALAVAHKEVAPPEETPVVSSNVRMISIADLIPNPNQPRQQWDDEKDDEGCSCLDRLAQSIKNDGILQPLVVTNRNGKYLIVCGERRFRAAKMVGLKQIPCVLRPGLSDEQAIEIGLIENLQRENLTPVDEAHAIAALMSKCKYSQAAIGKRLGVSVAAVNYKLSLLKLSPELQREVKKGKLSETQGRAIVQAVNKAPVEKREAAMKEIHATVSKARETGSKVDTKAAATIARTVVEKCSKPASGETGKAPAKPTLPPTTPQEKSQAKAFAKAAGVAHKALCAFGKSISEKGPRTRLALAIVSTEPETVDQLKAFQNLLGAILAEVAEVRRQRMLVKIG